MSEDVTVENEILCTTERRRMTGGSYIIRCRDFKGFVEHCTQSVRVHLYSHDQLIYKPNVTYNNDGWKKDFDASVTVKMGLTPKPRFGKVFMDVVDRYTTWDGLDSEVEVIVQSKYHAQDEFPNHTYHVVEHWYNSFPEDMLSSSMLPKFDLPKIQPVSNMKMATVWTNMKQPCPALTFDNNSDIIYDCINERFGIANWYQKYVNSSVDNLSDSRTQMQRLALLLQDPTQGPGRIYYELFWKYHVLVVPAKTASPEKLRYGNVQRAVSQMRSGVPVLLEIYGEVLEDFMDMYNYTCVYKSSYESSIHEDMNKGKTGKASKKANPPNVSAPSKHHPGNNNSTFARKYWTLDEAVMAMKESLELRRKCQEEGLAIAADYSPASLVEPSTVSAEKPKALRRLQTAAPMAVPIAVVAPVAIPVAIAATGSKGSKRQIAHYNTPYES
ncbi:MAG: hypothetical protein SGBAC_005239 [Bacillariaceae sp.]